MSEAVEDAPIVVNTNSTPTASCASDNLTGGPLLAGDAEKQVGLPRGKK